jgi:hypothetical protein
MTPHLDHPPTECELCGRAVWWRYRRRGSPWVCGVCLPPKHEPHEVEWSEVPLLEPAP